MEYSHLTRELRDISRSEDRLWHDEITGVIGAWPDYRGLMRS